MQTLAELDLAERTLRLHPHQLSGGMRQRVLIGLAGYVDPDIVLADEPTTALDVVVQRQILESLVRLQRARRNSIVIVSHDLGLHAQVAGRVAVLYAGRLAEIGTADTVLRQPAHPYTRGLVDALPRLGDKQPRLGIEGRPPDFAEHAAGLSVPAALQPRHRFLRSGRSRSDSDGRGRSDSGLHSSRRRCLLMAARAILEVRNLRKVYRQGGLFGGNAHPALAGVSLALRPEDGKVLAIVGELGSGKTTLARILLRLVSADAGEISVAGHKIVAPGERTVDNRTLRRLVQPIFQNPFEAFSLQLPLEEYLLRTAINLGDAATRGDPLPAVERALADVGLSYSKVAGKGIRAFSGGELQRISVARALIAKPLLIVADEPVSMVDASLRMTIVNLFKELSNRLDVAFVYITHDLSTAYYLSDVMAIMRQGELVEFGRPETILQSPRSDYTRALLDAIPTLDRRWNI